MRIKSVYARVYARVYAQLLSQFDARAGVTGTQGKATRMMKKILLTQRPLIKVVPVAVIIVVIAIIRI